MILTAELDEKTLLLVATPRKITGAVIPGAVADRPATAAGLRDGDVIYEINNRTVRNLKDLMDAARELKEDLPEHLPRPHRKDPLQVLQRGASQVSA